MARRRPEPQLIDDVPAEEREFTEVVESAFLTYSVSTITERALPDVRDGLKPVHRRILWSMFTSGYRPDRPYVKCARVTGDVIGKYHPHGDQAVYLALARLAQPWVMNLPLIDPHGNFGSPADGPAAQRYTECRLSPVAMALLEDIREDTVDLVPNYDSREEEPVVLPARLPNLLINGVDGIAVGISTSIPPHNPTEVLTAALHLLDHPEATDDDLADIVQGPDFPTGGVLLGSEGYRDAYRTGNGTVQLRATATIETPKRGGPEIVVTEIPYQTSVEAIETRIADLVAKGTLTGLRAIRNESADGNTRLVIVPRPEAVPEVVLASLFKHTQLQTTVRMNLVALDHGRPVTFTLSGMLRAWQAHQEDVILRRSRYRLRKAEDRLHIVEGLLRALDMIDAIIAAVRASDDRAEARAKLMAAPFDFSDRQAEHILDLTIARLTRLARADLEGEAEALRATIVELRRIIDERPVLLKVLRGDLRQALETYGLPRRSPTIDDSGKIDTSALIPSEPLVVAATGRWYLKATPLRSRAAKVPNVGADDTITHLWDLDTTEDLVVFTDRAKMYRLAGHLLPTERPTAIVNLADLASGEAPVLALTGPELEATEAVVVLTASGSIKRVATADLVDMGGRRDGAAIGKVDGEDRVVAVRPLDRSDGTLVVATALGQAIRFATSEVRVMGRAATGVRAINLGKGDRAVDVAALGPAGTLLDAGSDEIVVVAAANGSAKRVRADELPATGRGGKGFRIYQRLAGSTVLALQVVTDNKAVFLAVTAAGAGVPLPVTQAPFKARDAGGSAIVGQEITALVPQPDLDRHR